MSCPTSRCLSRPEPALNAPGVARSSRCRWASMTSLHAEWVESRRGLRAAAVSTCRRRAASSTSAVSSSSAAVLSCSCCASMYQTSARSTGWRFELALHRRRQLICPSEPVRGGERCWLSACRRPGIPNAPGSTRRRQLSVFGLFSLLLATIEGPVHWWTGARIRRVRRGGTAAKGVRGMEAALVPPMLDPRFVRIPAFWHGSATITDHPLRGDT
jgi:hypothetical protein